MSVKIKSMRIAFALAFLLIVGSADRTGQRERCNRRSSHRCQCH